MRLKEKIKKLALLCVVLGCSGSLAFAGSYEPFSEGNTGEPINVGNEFIPFAADVSSDSDQPVLYGPGGDPIGGLPVNEGILLLLAGGMIYLSGKVINKRKISN
jgi:hypothetical protein